MPKNQPRFTTARIDLFCRMRLASVLPADDLEHLRIWLGQCLNQRQFPPYRGKAIDTVLIAEAAGIDPIALIRARPLVQPICDALCRALADEPLAQPAERRQHRRRVNRKGSSTGENSDPAFKDAPRPEPTKRGRKPLPIVEHPEPLWTVWDEPEDLSAALKLHIARHGETIHALARSVSAMGSYLEHHTLANWVHGTAAPRSVTSLAALDAIERRYKLPTGSLRALLPHQARATVGTLLNDLPMSERRRLAWHLPEDFHQRPIAEQDEILAWVRTNIITGATEYRRYQAVAMRQRFAVRFTSLEGGARPGKRKAAPRPASVANDPRLSPAVNGNEGDVPPSTVVDAPARLQREMTDLLRFKTSTLTALGLRRSGVWNKETASQKIEHLGLMFGAFAASPDGEVRGYGADLASLSFALFVFPSVWDWYLQWREARRGFYTRWETDMLAIGLSLTRKETGWIRQMPRLADHLVPIPGLVSVDDIAAARADWDGACDVVHKHNRNRVNEIGRVARIHRDPFEPILAVLETKSPVGEYRKITEEIMRRMPDERRYPKAAAEAVRAFLILRLGLHTGLRQKNLRELLVCPPGRLPTSERLLEERRRGELRWNAKEHGWEILIPSVAFKNANSSFFGAKPFRLILPDLGDLYATIRAWIDRHRARLIGVAEDPGTFFVKSVKQTSASAAYDQNTFFEAWRLAIQRYGIHNPYTKRGAIVGLLPHGPHNVRDVLATHILKQTGSYEQASYAIQDTPDMVAQHYGRFLPQDKAEIAARILNQVWEAA